MKLLLTLALLLTFSLSMFAQDKLTNSSIIEMKSIGFSDDVIISKIKSSEAKFDTSISALKELKEKGISDAIIMTIMNSGEKESNDSSNEILLKTGIYFTEGDELVRILPTVFSGTKTNTLGSAFSYGIASAKIKSVLNNAQSTNIIKNPRPEFTFIFATQGGDAFSIDPSNWWFFSASTPNQFVLAKLNSKKNKRELVTGKVNVYAGTNIGVDEKSIIPFNIEIVNDYEYIVTTKQPLQNGEYCFFYQGSVPQGVINQSVFDFSIQSEGE